jgi:hypothetical protein
MNTIHIEDEQSHEIDTKSSQSQEKPKLIKAHKPQNVTFGTLDDVLNDSEEESSFASDTSVIEEVDDDESDFSALNKKHTIKQVQN